MPNPRALLAWPASDSVFFLGMGTGITAGEALSRNDFPKVEKVVACELSPNGVAASRKYFTAGPDGSDLTNGLYTDPRAEVVIADGRNHLLANRDKYSMINARTMLAVFPQVSLWRGNFQPGAEVAAMVGHADHTPLPASTLDVGRAKQRAVEGATHLDMQDLMLPLAGSAFHRAWIARIHGDEESWKNEWETFLTQWTEPEPAEGAAD